MNIDLLAAPFELIAGLLVGIIFGFILNKAGVTRFSTITGQLLLKDFTVMKVILTAIITGSTILYFTKSFIVDVSMIVIPTTLLSALFGGAIFGVGMATLGYCPGTCVGALSLKAKDTWLGLIGMVLGSAFYAEIYPWVKATIKQPCMISKATLPEHFNIPAWYIIAAATALLFIVHKATTMKKKSSAVKPTDLV